MNKLRILKNVNIVLFIVAFLSLNFVGITFSKYVSRINKKAILNVSVPTYTVIFHSNNGLDQEETQDFIYGTSQNLRANTFTNGTYNFSNWNTEIDGSGTSYSDGQSVNNLTNIDHDVVDLYAQWVDGVAEVNGVGYPSIQKAIEIIDKEGTETTLRLLQDTNEHITTYTGQNIIFDLGNHTLGNVEKGTPVLENAATIYLTNGIITTNADKAGAINNRNGGVMTVGPMQVLTVGSRQAIFNDKATLTVEDGAYLFSSGADRAALQNQSSSTVLITGGSIISTGHSAINNSGTLTIGTKDDSADSSIIIRGKAYGVTTGVNFKFYDGIIEGKTKAINDEKKIIDKEEDYIVVHSTEVIDTVTYDKVFLGEGVTIIFDANGGTVENSSTLTKIMSKDSIIGTLPSASRLDYKFDGWYTDAEGGTQITTDTIASHDTRYYAHWSYKQTNVAECRGEIFNSLQEAINYAQAGVETEVTLLKNVSTKAEIPGNRKIRLNLNGYKISSFASNAVFENYGDAYLYNGSLSSNNSVSTINNNSGNLVIDSVSITATGNRQAVYIIAGSVEIKGSSYIESSTTDVSSDTGFERGTIQCLVNGTLKVTSGTIVGNIQTAISNEGTTTIGDSDGVIDNTSITIIGKNYGVNNIGTFNFYDGVIKGLNGAIEGVIADQEPNTNIVIDSEVISGDTYETKYLELQ